MGARAGLDRFGKISPLTGILSPDRPTRRQSLYRLRYPAHPEYIKWMFFHVHLYMCAQVFNRLILPPFLHLYHPSSFFSGCFPTNQNTSGASPTSYTATAGFSLVIKCFTLEADH
jgi:hypothetical protein